MDVPAGALATFDMMKPTETGKRVWWFGKEIIKHDLTDASENQHGRKNYDDTASAIYDITSPGLFK